jgi:hypothetical protein
MKSIIDQDRNNCFLCGRYLHLEEHHLLPGRNRKNSEKYGLKVSVCRECHNKIHSDIQILNNLRQLGQTVFERKYSHEKWMKVFMKNYL